MQFPYILCEFAASEYIKKEREYLAGSLAGLGFKVFDSDTVFILVKDEGGKYGDLYDRLLQKGILIRKCDDFNGLTGRFFRIAVRSHEDNMVLIDAIRLIADDD